jgi:hypothetical protein
VPYFHVVSDKEMADLLARSRVGEWTGTRIARRFDDLPALVSDLVGQVRSAGGDLTFRDWSGPGEGFCLDIGELPKGLPGRPPAA